MQLFGFALQSSEQFEKRDFTAEWTQARERTGFKQEYVAFLMQMAPAQLAEQVAGRSHLSWHRLFHMAALGPDGLRFFKHFLMACMERERIDFGRHLEASRLEHFTRRVLEEFESEAMPRYGKEGR